MTLPPLRFQPLIKRTLWGGRRLGDLGKPIGDGNDYAESWEIVDHGEDQSVVTGGRAGDLRGMTLAAVMSTVGDRLMGRGVPRNSFPLLLKYLDCNRVLSVQVHPDDAYGAKMTPPDLGKTEAWFVVHAEPDATIYAGLRPGTTRDRLTEAIRSGDTESCLHQFHPEPGDVVFIPAGTVHALGGGLVIAEIQQSSNTTFRLFDWNRTDANGNSRPLHIEPALEVIDFHGGPISPVRGERSQSGRQNLIRCDKFTLDGLYDGTADVAVGDRFEIITVPIGSATLRSGNETERLERGDTVLVPADSDGGELTVDDDSIALIMGLPQRD